MHSERGTFWIWVSLFGGIVAGLMLCLRMPA